MLGDEYDELDEQNVSFIVLKQRGVESWSWKDEDEDDDDDDDDEGHDAVIDFLLEDFLLSVFKGFLGALGGRVDDVLLCFFCTLLFARVFCVWDLAALVTVVVAESEDFFEN